jgi:hypothetical protein
MLTILGVKVSIETIAFFALFISSEVIGASKLKENSVVQLLLTIVNTFKPLRKEDDKVKNIKDAFKG